MKKLFLCSLWFFMVYAAGCCFAGEDQLVNSAKEDELDLSSLKDPFISQLPKVVEQIVKTPVDRTLQKTDNNSVQQKTGSIIPMPLIHGASVKKQQMPNLDLQGVVWGGQHPEAIINGEVLSLGQTIDNVKIESISKDGVKVSFEGKTFYVHMQ